MGTLRLEPMDGPVNPLEYHRIATMLINACRTADDYDFYWNLEEGEDRNLVKEKFEYVAERENVPLFVRALRKERRLHLSFVRDATQSARTYLLEKYKGKIVEVLKITGRPMRKRDILAYGKLDPAKWRAAITALREEGVVEPEGQTRRLRYRLCGDTLQQGFSG